MDNVQDWWHLRMARIKYAVLGSGSSGNSYVFCKDGAAILVDCGFSFKELSRRLDETGVSAESVRGLFLTHLHPDHACGAGVLVRRLGIPVFVSRDAVEGEAAVWAKLRIPQEMVHMVSEGELVENGGFTLSGFRTTHDSRGSLGWIVDHTDGRFMVLTDSGSWSEDMAQEAESADVLFLEANYDRDMLRTGPYPIRLQKRISGKWGHLSNDDAFDFLKRSGHLGIDKDYSGKERKIFFIHLSAVNNDPVLLEKQAGVQMWNNSSFTVCERGKIYSEEWGL